MKFFKSLVLVFLFSITFFQSYSSNGGGGGDTPLTCIAGGPGASHCSHSVTFLYLFSTTYEITCDPGYYACCNNTGASCVPWNGAGGSW